MTMRNLYLHIGFHKTGSSALQECLADNRQALQEAGFFYPHSLGNKYPAHVDFSWALNDRPPAWSGFSAADAEHVVALYQEQIEAAGCENIIMSSEDFVLLESNAESIERLREFFSAFSVKVIAYVRNPVDFIVSLYSHAVRSRAVMCDVFEYVDSHFNFRSADYAVRLQPWVKVFGRESIVVRPYDKNEFVNNNIVDDFASIIGFQGELTQKERTSNVGVHPWLVSAYLEVAKADIAEDQKVERLGELLQIGANLPKANAARYLMNPMLCRVIDKSYEVMRSRLRRDFGVEI